jgi:soluble lytic murein transglycosylase-like protein
MKQKQIILFLIMVILLTGLSFPVMTYADIYRYVDKDGIIHLTNVPTQKDVKYDLILREKRVLIRVSPADINKYDHLITRAAEKYKVDSALVKAVIKAESNFNHQAVSRKGAKGLMQLMPATASSLQVQDSFHPEKNIDGGVRYLSYLLKLFNGNLSLALAAYNAGENAVAKYHYSIPPYRETQNYVQRVLSYLSQYRSEMR